MTLHPGTCDNIVSIFVIVLRKVSAEIADLGIWL
jgi:hypothetical protein